MIESILGKNEFVEQIWVYGSSFEAVLVAVVVPNKAPLMQWAKEQVGVHAPSRLHPQLYRSTYWVARPVQYCRPAFMQCVDMFCRHKVVCASLEFSVHTGKICFAPFSLQGGALAGEDFAELCASKAATAAVLESLTATGTLGFASISAGISSITSCTERTLSIPNPSTPASGIATDHDAQNSHLNSVLHPYAGKAARLKGFEFPKAIHLEPHPFSIEHDLITPKLSLKRPQLLKYYKKQVIKACNSFS